MRFFHLHHLEVRNKPVFLHLPSVYPAHPLVVTFYILSHENFLVLNLTVSSNKDLLDHLTFASLSHTLKRTSETNQTTVYQLPSGEKCNSRMSMSPTAKAVDTFTHDFNTSWWLGLR